MLEQSRRVAQSLWTAVRTLYDRVETARWAQADPDLHRLAAAMSADGSAAGDEAIAAELRRMAQAFDLTVALTSANDEKLVPDHDDQS